MILRTKCPSCGASYRLQDPLPPEGKKYRCTCGTIITITYPDEVVEAMRDDGHELRPDGRAISATIPSTGPVHAPPEPEPRVVPRATSPRAASVGGGLGGSVSEPSGQGLTPPPSMPPMDASYRRSPDGFDEAPPPPPPLEATLRRGGQLTPTDSLRMPPPLNSMPRTPAVPEPAATPEPGWTDSSPTPPPRRAPEPSPAADLQEPPEAAPPAARTARRRPRAPQGRRPFLSRWYVKYPLLAVVLAFFAGAVGFFAIVSHYSKDLPSVAKLEIYEPPTVTVVQDSAGGFVGEFFEEQRYVVPLDEIPLVVQNAFVSAEDAAFWEHKGLDFMGIARAMLKNVQERRMAQGASTITQQVARSFLLSREKKLERKIKEAILSTRVEKHFDKQHILYLYLNQIYLGHGAYGVEAAARLYFDKHVKDLGLAEAAILAGLPQAPHTYSPNRNFAKAKARQEYVLGQMVRRGYATQDEADAALALDLTFVKKHDRNLDKAPYYVEHARRYLVEKYGHEAVYNEGLTVTLAMDPELQAAANKAVAEGVRYADKRLGWRGPRAQHESAADIAKTGEAIDRERIVAHRPYDPGFSIPDGAIPPDLIPALVEGEITRGVVGHVAEKYVLVDVGSKRGLMPVSEWTWCHKVDPEKNWKYFKCKSVDDMLAVGDEIDVRVVAATETWEKTLPKDWDGPKEFPRLGMEQTPDPEASLLSLRVTDGHVLAMVGGSDYEESEFNRAIQAKRQVGSTFKPLVYAASLDYPDKRFTPSTILLDAPIVEAMTGVKGELWKPGNSGGEYLGETTFRRGLVLSRNIVTLKILQAIGVEYTLDYVKRFGFDTALEPNMSMGLGSSALTMLEMVRAYTVFPTLGDRREPVFVTEVRDRHGNVLESNTAGELTEDVMDPATAYQMVSLMHDVVRAGTARGALELGVPVAGKTGTTNGYRDAWFMGYTPELLTSVWVGLDDFRSMGKGQFGGEVALPIWVDYMKPAVAKYPPSEYEKPSDVVFATVDSETGKLARNGQNGVRVAYRRGHEPTEQAPAIGAVDAADFLSGGF